MEIRRITQSADVRTASRLFDGPPRPQDTERFLADPRHHLLLAYVGDHPAGMISGVEMTHPDKGTEMFLYELGVDESFRRQGIGQALVSALADVARQRGCYRMWVLTDEDNLPARATYNRVGGVSEHTQVMFTWDFRDR